MGSLFYDPQEPVFVGEDMLTGMVLDLQANRDSVKEGLVRASNGDDQVFGFGDGNGTATGDNLASFRFSFRKHSAPKDVTSAYRHVAK